jgi:uncharacterized protein (DUF58 family)
METSELLRNITTLPVIASGLAEEMLAGNFRSVFKGQGMEFDEARHYEIGDDIRSIDWNASARFGTPYVKMFREEKELSILLLIDISPSMQRGNIISRNINPYEQGLISAALIAFSAEHTGQQVGALFFDRDITKILPPRRGRRNIMTLIMTALRYQKEITARRGKNGSNMAAAFEGAQRLLKRRALVIIISDFFSVNWEQEMASLCRKHDCLAIKINDPPDLGYPGLLTIEDPETGIRIEAPAGIESFNNNWLQWHRERSEHWTAVCKRCGASFLELSASADAPAALLKFFSGHSHAQYRDYK